MAGKDASEGDPVCIPVGLHTEGNAVTVIGLGPRSAVRSPTGLPSQPPPLVRADEQQLINCPGKRWGKASRDSSAHTLRCKPRSAESRIRPIVFNASASKLPLNNTVYLWLIEAKNFAITDKRGRSAPHIICIFKDRGLFAAA